MAKPRRFPACGFTLIEVLVALCLLSLAALSIVSLQWRSLHASRQSALHGTAVQLGADIADELRAGTAPDAQAQAAWMARAGAALPGGRALVCRDASPWDEAAGAYRWHCEPAAGPLLVKLAWQYGAAAPQVVVTAAPVRQ